MVFTADCTPILFHDPVTGAVGAAHAGWRGTAQDIAGRVITAMVENFGCDPKNIRAAIGPNLGSCHFATDGDVPNALIGTFGQEALSCIEKREGKFYPDLKAINALALLRRGVTDIEVSESCTWCESDRFWSHRVTRGDRGSQGALITCTG
jgi:YfiH family protein